MRDPSTSAPSCPRGPQVTAAVATLASMGGVVAAAATVVTRLDADQSDWWARCPDPGLRADLRALADAVYDLDYRTTRLSG